MSDVGGTEEVDARALLAQPRDFLVARLGNELIAGGLGTARDGATPQDFMKWAENWLQRNGEALKEGICGTSLLDATQGDELLEFAAIADFVAATLLNRPAAYTVAAIVVKYGVGRLCTDA